LAARLAVSGGLRKLALITVPALVMASAVVAVGAEVWVRLRWDARRGRPGFFLSDPVRGQRLAAGYDGWFAGVPVHINNLELRAPYDYDLAKTPKTFRILMLGDSVTFGHGSVYEHTYPVLLEQKLKAWKPSTDWQVWNAAVPGYNTSQELAHLLEVGDRFRPDLVVVGFFENDLVGNTRLRPPGVVRTWESRLLSFATRHVYSLELYKKVYLSLAWYVSGADEYHKRLEHLGTEDALLAAASDATTLAEQRLTPFERFTDGQVAALRCIYGMSPNPDTVAEMRRDPDFAAWLEAVRGFQDLHRSGRFRILFFVNDAPDRCGYEPAEDFFYDGGTAAIDRFYREMLGAGTPVVTSFEAFRHLRPSQMPAARAHALGNANEIKAEVLFDALKALPVP
jgi:hypothetical protein